MPIEDMSVMRCLQRMSVGEVSSEDMSVKEISVDKMSVMDMSVDW